MGKALDVHFSNNELEWYTKENVGIVLHGLLLRIKEVNVGSRRKMFSRTDDDEKADVRIKIPG